MSEPTQCQECKGPIEAAWAKWPGERSKLRFCSKACANRATARNRKSTTYRRLTTRGYVELWKPNHPMANKGGYIMEHRYLMAEHLGRLLSPGEVVHHRNEIKSDNQISNLEVMDKRAHDRAQKPKPRPFDCPNCGAHLVSFGTHSRVRRVEVVTLPGE